MRQKRHSELHEWGDRNHPAETVDAFDHFSGSPGAFSNLTEPLCNTGTCHLMLFVECIVSAGTDSILVQTIHHGGDGPDQTDVESSKDLVVFSLGVINVIINPLFNGEKERLA